MEYKEFLKTKKHLLGEFGFEPTFIPKIAFDFQKEIIQKAVRKGRMAVFADTGLGKTLIQLSIAQNIVEHTNKKVLILTPLAVGFQFIKEAINIGVDNVYQSKEGSLHGNIIVTNYQRLHLFNCSDFECVILDESSILKNFNGKIKSQITSFIKKVKYRFLSTATPSPNDFTELGTSSEALGYMGYMVMLSKFFKNNNNSIDSGNRNVGSKYYLKPHAEKDFFRWVNQWSIMIKKPSDLGYSNDRYILPKLHVIDHTIKNKSLIDIGGQIQMFTPIAKTMLEVRHEQKQTLTQRCEKAVDLSLNKVSVYWSNTNKESGLIKKMDKDSYEILGSMSIDKKEDILINFAEGNIDRIITKAKITGMGLNWQHCNHSVIFPTWSYEQYYQAIRRFYRFGQKKEVTVHRISSDGQTRVIQALNEKSKKNKVLYDNLLNNTNIIYESNTKEFNKNISLPKFI